MSVIAIVQQFDVYSAIIPKATINTSTGFYGHRNVLATYLLLHFPLTIYFYFSSQTINKKIITGILSILIVLALIFTRSRGGQVVLAVQLSLHTDISCSKKRPRPNKKLFGWRSINRSSIRWSNVFNKSIRGRSVF